MAGAGLIRLYGVSTWQGFTPDEESPDALSLAGLDRCAREIAGERHRFRCVMLPINAARIDAPCGQKQNVRFDGLLRCGGRGSTVTAASALNGGRLARGSSATVLSALTPAQAALQSVLRIPGITVTLVGMKKSRHVDENLQLAFGGDAVACVGGQSEVT